MKEKTTRKALTGLLAIMLSSGTLAAVVAPAFTGAGLPSSYAAEQTDPIAGLSASEKTWVNTQGSAYESTLGGAMGVSNFKFKTTEYTKLTADQLKTISSLPSKMNNPLVSGVLKSIPFDLATTPTGWYAKDGTTAGKEGDPVYKLSIKGKESGATVTYTFTTLDKVPGTDTGSGDNGGTTTPDKPSDSNNVLSSMSAEEQAWLNGVVMTTPSTTDDSKGFDGWSPKTFTYTKMAVADVQGLQTHFPDGKSAQDEEKLFHYTGANGKDIGGRQITYYKDGAKTTDLKSADTVVISYTGRASGKTVTYAFTALDKAPDGSGVIITPGKPSTDTDYKDLAKVTATYTGKDGKTAPVDGFAPTDPNHAAYTIPDGATVKVDGVPSDWTLKNDEGSLVFTVTKGDLKATYTFQYKTDSGSGDNNGTTDPDKPGTGDNGGTDTPSTNASYDELKGVKAMAGGKTIDGFTPTDPNHAAYKVQVGQEVTLLDVPSDWTLDKSLNASGDSIFTLTKGDLKAVYQFTTKDGNTDQKPTESVTYDLDLSKAEHSYGFYGDANGAKVDGLTDDLTDTIKPGVYEVTYEAKGGASDKEQTAVGSLFATSKLNDKGQTFGYGNKADIKVRDAKDTIPDDQNIPVSQTITVNQGGLGWIIGGQDKGTVHLKLVKALDGNATNGQNDTTNGAQQQNVGNKLANTGVTVGIAAVALGMLGTGAGAAVLARRKED